MIDTSKPFDVTCWYLNQRRWLELLGTDGVGHPLAAINNLPYYRQPLSVLATFKRAAIAYMRTHAIDPLGKQLLSPGDLTGKFFTHYSNFWFQGLTKLHPDRHPPPDPKKTASGYAKLEGFRPNLRLTFNFHPRHLTSDTAWGEMSGQKRKFMFGVIQEDRPDALLAIPYLVGDILLGGDTDAWPTAGQWLHHRELHVDGLDCFEAVRTLRPARSVTALEPLKDIPEHEIKAAFADIIGEPCIPKDWGGERSDLYSTYVCKDGHRIATAFAFKGPSRFQPMTMAHLGKNGDQIDRLFTEPADLLVLQHCHQVTPPVRSAMRAYAQRVGDPRLYCVIDGFDTLRVLRAYGKCGL